jgi:hypothetical protein
MVDLLTINEHSAQEKARFRKTLPLRISDSVNNMNRLSHCFPNRYTNP